MDKKNMRRLALCAKFVFPEIDTHRTEFIYWHQPTVRVAIPIGYKDGQAHYTSYKIRTEEIQLQKWAFWGKRGIGWSVWLGYSKTVDRMFYRNWQMWEKNALWGWTPLPLALTNL